MVATDIDAGIGLPLVLGTLVMFYVLDFGKYFIALSASNNLYGVLNVTDRWAVFIGSADDCGIGTRHQWACCCGREGHQGCINDHRGMHLYHVLAEARTCFNLGRLTSSQI